MGGVFVEKMHSFGLGHDKIPSQVQAMMMDNGEGGTEFRHKEALPVSLSWILRVSSCSPDRREQLDQMFSNTTASLRFY